MKMLDVNSEKNKVVLLVHPMLSSAQGMKQLLSDQMGNEYRYLIPDLSAHGEAATIPYLSAKRESEYIYKYLKTHQIDELDLAFGASLGAVVLLQLLNYKDIKIHKAVFEGCSVWQASRLHEVFTRKFFIYKHRRAIKNRSLAVKKIVALYGETAEVMADNLIAMDEDSIRHICHDCAFVELPSLSKEEQLNCTFSYGSKEFDLIGARRILPEKYPFAKMKIWNGYQHCTKLTSDPLAYCDMLKNEMITNRI